MSSKRVPPLQRDMRTELDRLMVTLRMTLLGHDQTLVRPDDRAAIVAGVPAVHIATDSAGYSIRRQRLRFTDGSARITVLARTRPVPQEVAGRRCLIQTALNRFGRPVPVSCMDLDRGTLHVLVDLSGARAVAGAPGTNAAGGIVGKVYREPVVSLLREAGGPRVGTKVATVAHSILDSHHRNRRILVGEELSALESLAGTGILPTSLARRIEALKQWLGSDRPHCEATPVTAEQAELEVSRMANLVSSRACGYIRLSGKEITGLVNPRTCGRHAFRPVLFRLSLTPSTSAPTLRLWNPLRPDSRGDTPCLGQGDRYLGEFQATRDLYGMVDLILNYLETNRIAMFSMNRGPVFQRWMGYVAELF